MKKNTLINSSQGTANIPTLEQRSSYHTPTTTAQQSQERRCDNCQYRVALNECQQFKCLICGTYIICDYCYEELVEMNPSLNSNVNNGSLMATTSADNLNKKNGTTQQQQMGTYQKLKCVYCSSKHSINDVTVRTVKSFGFIPPKGTNKVQISTLSKEKLKKLANLRVIQKTLVYVIGIAPEIASEETLKSPEYFGQYGDLLKVVVNTNNIYNASRGGPSYSAYLTYSHPRESAIAILSVDQYMLNERMLRASFGTSKFCQFFMNGQKCTNKDCLYMHEIRVDLEAYTKEEMQNNKFVFQEQQKIAIKLSRALELTIEEFRDYNRQMNKNLPEVGSHFKPQLPSPDTIYYKDFHFLDEPLINRNQMLAQQKQLQQSISINSNTQSNTSNINSNSNNSGHPSGTGQSNNNSNINNCNISSAGGGGSLSGTATATSTSTVNNSSSETSDNKSSQQLQIKNQEASSNIKSINNQDIGIILSQTDKGKSGSNKEGSNNKQSNSERSLEKSGYSEVLENLSKETSVANKTVVNAFNVNGEITLKATTGEGSDDERPTQRAIEQIETRRLGKGHSKKKKIIVEARQHHSESKSTSSHHHHHDSPSVFVTTPNLDSPKESSKKVMDYDFQKNTSPPLPQSNGMLSLDRQTSLPAGNSSSFVNISHEGLGTPAAVAVHGLQSSQSNKKSDLIANLSKTPTHHQISQTAENSQNSTNSSSQFVLQMASQFLVSPLIFRKKSESRFNFARKLDQAKSCDMDEIEVPGRIQDLIERNIRTLSNNSLSNKSDIFNKQDVLNFDLKDMKEKWLTLKEKLIMHQDSIQIKSPSEDGLSNSNNNNPLQKNKGKKGGTATGGNSESNNHYGGSQRSYNLTEHSVNIRVKYNRQSSKDHY